MTKVGVEAPYTWRFDEHDLLDQVDDICTGERLRLVAGLGPDGTWGAFFTDLPSVPREERRRAPTFRADSLERAVWGAVSAFRRNQAGFAPICDEPAVQPTSPGATRETRLEARLRCLIAGTDAVAESIELDDGKHLIVKTARLDALRGAARRTKQDLEGGTI